MPKNPNIPGGLCFFHLSAIFPGFDPPIDGRVEEEEGREEHHVHEVGGDAVGVVHNHPDQTDKGLGAAEAQDVPA